MCELLGLSFNKKIRPSFSFVGLLAASDYHCHGWGLAHYPDDGPSAAVYKEFVAGCDSKLALFLASYHEMQSKIFISHIRRSSKGRLSHANSHPFTRCFNGREWAFAHNGTLHDYPGSRQGMTYHPLGATDSEYAFCKLLSQLKRYRIRPVKRAGYVGYAQNDFWDIYAILSEINVQGNGAMNILFSDSNHLFCYRDSLGARDLFYLKRQYPFDHAELRDSDLLIDLNLEKGKTEKGFVIASEPLSTEDWRSFAPGQLLVFKNGRKVADINGNIQQ